MRWQPQHRYATADDEELTPPHASSLGGKFVPRPSASLRTTAIGSAATRRGCVRRGMNVVLIKWRQLQQTYPNARALLVCLLVLCCVLLFGKPLLSYVLKSILGGRYYEKIDYPNFIIAGTWKSGTTSLLHYFKLHHPNVCMAPKEVNYFHTAPKYHWREWFGTIPAYKEKFSDCVKRREELRAKNQTLVIGEKSASYLWGPFAPVRISRHLIKAKIIFVLRNPIDRLYSHWYMMWCKNQYSGDFETFLDRWEESRKAGFYYNQLRRWFAKYDRNYILVLKSEDFFKSPRRILHQIEEFIGAPHYNWTEEQLVTWGSSPKCLSRVGERPPYSDEFRLELEKFYYKANENLKNLLGPEFDYNKSNKFYHPDEEDEDEDYEERDDENQTGDNEGQGEDINEDEDEEE